METPKHLLTSNQAWAEKINQQNPDFFSSLSRQQAPEYLWIGCSDSRVPANQIIDIMPGAIFVHRNIANVVVHTDLNCLSVIQYAVEVLKVKHIIVCGHYGCGGIQAALEDKQFGLIDNWLGHIKDVIRLHRRELNQLNDQQIHDRLCELNVMEQVLNVCNTNIVQQTWQSGVSLSVNAWIYSLENGIIRDLNLTIRSKNELDEKSSTIGLTTP